jgi:hypothetical protein
MTLFYLPDIEQSYSISKIWDKVILFCLAAEPNATLVVRGDCINGAQTTGKDIHPRYRLHIKKIDYNGSYKYKYKRLHP